ncbi:MAG: VIT domain-containing protein, partial [Proteobacteria bacterium]|nr:VIT domain-containing protein [Pseudomonadota bacterium]
MSDRKQDERVLEDNVSQLLEGGGAPPRLAADARARMRAALIAKHSADPASAHPQAKRRPLLAVGVGVFAAAAGALIVTRVVGGSDDVTTGSALVASDNGKLADGSTWLVEPGAKVTQLGPRHVRVVGAALLDVVPGKGPFTVDTAQGTITVLGTRFMVAADERTTTTAVVRGSVKLATAQGDVTLHAGEQGIAEHAKPPTRGPAPRLSHLVSWAAQARKKAEGQDVEPLHHGSLFAKDPGVRSHPPWGDEYPLPMKQLKVDVVVDNQVARVALDQTFHNDQDQALEGTYRFAIPPDAALQRLAMYVDGNLMESGVVERMAARRIYEELVYRRV